jgi:hypothetical protein
MSLAPHSPARARFVTPGHRLALPTIGHVTRSYVR